METSFDSNDILILLAIHESGNSEKGASLRNIIAFADYVNHAVLTYEEFNGAWQKLSPAGLVEQKGELFYASTAFIDWWTKIFKGKNVTPARAMKEMTGYLNKLKKVEKTGSETVPKDIFQLAVDDYLK